MNATTRSVRKWAKVGIVGGLATLVGALTVQGVVVPRTTVAPELWTYPWDGGAFFVVTILYAVLHAMVFAGLWDFGSAVSPAPAVAPGPGTRWP